MPVEKYSRAPEILAHSRAIGRHFDLYANACFQTEVTEHALGRGRIPLDHRHQPRRRHQGAFRHHGQRPPAPAQAAGHPRRGDVQGPFLPHQPLGLCLHRRRFQRRTHGPCRQAGRHHRHRRHGGAVRAASGGGGQATVRLPAHALVHRCAQQPPHRSRLGRKPGARLAAAPDGQFQHPGLRRHSRTRTWSTTAGPTSSGNLLHPGPQA